VQEEEQPIGSEPIEEDQNEEDEDDEAEEDQQEHQEEEHDEGQGGNTEGQEEDDTGELHEEQIRQYLAYQQHQQMLMAQQLGEEDGIEYGDEEEEG